MISYVYIWICIDCVYRESSYIHMCIMIYIEHMANKIQDCKNLLLCEIPTHYTLESEFLSTKMEESSFLKAHLAKMHEIHLSLVDDFDYGTTDESAIYTVLHSLPPSYTDHVHGYVGRGESLEFSDFMDRLRYLEVEPIEGEVVDGEGICLIY